MMMDRMDGLVDQAVADLVERVRASVVEVRPVTGGFGAGTIWRSDGTIVTNYHVAPGAAAEVTLPGGRTFAARVVARDAADDLAVLHIPVSGLPAATIGDARALRPGELVLAVGHPVGFRGAVTVGVVHRAPAASVRQRELIQADLLLGPGNSGGPLVDARGRVAGINAMVSGGLGLAVPSHLVERLLAAEDDRAELGLEVQEVELPRFLLERLPPRQGPPPRRALVVLGTASGSVAEQAGLLPGDVLVALDGHYVAGLAGFRGGLSGMHDGTHRLDLLRGGEHRDAVITPGQRRQLVA